MKIFNVIYVGLSATDSDANGYLECKSFRSFEEAVDLLARMSKAELENLEDEGQEYEIRVNTEDVFEVSWAGEEEGVRIAIHETEI